VENLKWGKSTVKKKINKKEDMVKGQFPQIRIERHKYIDFIIGLYWAIYKI
jgi:hypothetical protein